MKTNGRIRELLATPCFNDIEYGHRVIWPLLDYLGIPLHARRPQFQIENPFGNGLLRLDYLLHHEDLPLVTIEGEPTARQFETGYRQAKNYSRNFKPRQRGCPMQERTVPFLITAAGGRAEMCRAIVRGLNIEYEPILQDGQPAFLEWDELLAEMGLTEPATALGPQQRVLIADTATQFFTELFEPIDAAPALRNQEDRKIVLFNRIIHLARQRDERAIQAACQEAKLGQRRLGQLLRTIGWYRQKIDSDEFTGVAVARGYRTFLQQPGGRGRHRYFTGESQSRPYWKGGRLRYRNVARFFTPAEVIQQMVRVAQPRAAESVIDMTCGTGGYLAECVEYVAQREDARRAQEFAARRLVGIDDDPFCVSCSRALLAFLYPQHAERFQVYLHNALYRRSPSDSEIDEDWRADTLLRTGRYDLVLGNPPGNDQYSGTNRREIERQWRSRFAHTEGGLMDHHCFLRRAVELARPEGGRICLLLPEGLLTRDNRGMPVLRQAIARECELRMVVTLPRVFKGNNARMAMVLMVRNPCPDRRRKVLLVEVREHWQDGEGVERKTDLFGELEATVNRYLGVE